MLFCCCCNFLELHWICLLLRMDRISANGKSKVGWHAKKKTKENQPSAKKHLYYWTSGKQKYVECVDTSEICLMRENWWIYWTTKNLFELATGALCTADGHEILFNQSHSDYREFTYKSPETICTDCLYGEQWKVQKLPPVFKIYSSWAYFSSWFKVCLFRILIKMKKHRNLEGKQIIFSTFIFNELFVCCSYEPAYN